MIGGQALQHLRVDGEFQHEILQHDIRAAEPAVGQQVLINVSMCSVAAAITRSHIFCPAG